MSLLTFAEHYQPITHHRHTLAHVGICHTEIWFLICNSHFKDEVDAALQPLFCVYIQLQDLPNKGLKLLGSELVDDASHLFEQSLEWKGFIVQLNIGRNNK